MSVAPLYAPTTESTTPVWPALRALHAIGGDVAHRLPFEAMAAMAEGFASVVTAEQLPVERGHSRRYTQLLATESYEVWLIAWAAGGTLDLHDHGSSTGVVRVVEGELVEAYSDLGRRHPLRSWTMSAGMTVAVPASRVHEVWNPAPEPALSVHVYSPPLTTMTYYDDCPERFLSRLDTDDGDVVTLEGSAAR